MTPKTKRTIGWTIIVFEVVWMAIRFMHSMGVEKVSRIIVGVVFLLMVVYFAAMLINSK